MSILFSRACEYAVVALIEMARHPEKKSWPIKELARQAKVPAPFLAKTFQILVSEGILHSKRGRQGGFFINKPLNDIHLWDVIKSIDGDIISRDCVLAFPGCDEDTPCPFHEQWADVCSSISMKLKNHTLAQLAQHH